MNEKYKYLIKNTGILTISNFASKILVFFLVPFYTSILTTSEYGTFDFIVSVAQLLTPLFTLNISAAIMRFLFDKETNKKEILSIGIKFFTIGLLFTSIFVIGTRLTGISIIISDYSFFVILYYLSYSLNEVLSNYCKGIERIKDLAIAGFLGTLSLVGFNIVFLLVIKIGLIGFFIANSLALLVPDLYYIVRLRIFGSLSLKYDNSLSKEMLSYSVPLIFTTIGWILNNTIDKYAVIFILGLSANGLISVAYKIPAIINALQGIFTSAWQISAVKEYESKDIKDFYSNTLIYVNSVMCIMCSILIISCDLIGKVLFAKEFFVAWQYVPFLLISSVVNTSSGVVGPILSAQKDSKTMAKSGIIGSLANLLLNIVLIYIIGIQGATIATAISSYIIYKVREQKASEFLNKTSTRKNEIVWVILCFQSMSKVYISHINSGISIAMEILLFACMVIAYKAQLNILFKKARDIIQRKK